MRTVAGYLAALLVGAMSVGVVAAETQQLKTNNVDALLHYSDGSIEQLQVVWSAVLSIDKRETGHASRPLQGQLFDTRRCVWDLRGSIGREMRLCSGSFGCLAIEPSDKIAQPALELVRQNRHYEGKLLWKGHYENCGEQSAKERFERDLAAARRELLGAFEVSVEADRQTVERLLSQVPGVRRVEFLDR